MHYLDAKLSIPVISKPHVSLNVHDVDISVAFYSALFGAEPVKHYREDTIVHSILCHLWLPKLSAALTKGHEHVE